MVLCVTLLALGCERRPSAASGPIRIVVTIPPLAGLARDVAPEAQVTTLIPPGTSEHGYEPTPGQLAALASADVVVYVGLDLDPKIARFVREHPSPSRGVVCFAQTVGIDAGEAHEDHDGHDHDEHEHAVDPHLWLDPPLVEKFAPALGDAIARAQRERGDSGAADATRRRAQEVVARVRTLHAELEAQLAPIKGRSIVTHHNAWSRLADRYGLSVAAVIRVNESAEPTPEAIAAAVDAIRARGARGIFVEPQFSPAAAESIARAAGARLGVLDPLGTGDWFELMRSNARSLVETLKE